MDCHASSANDERIAYYFPIIQLILCAANTRDREALTSIVVELLEDALADERLRLLSPHQVHGVALEIHRAVPGEQLPAIFQASHLYLVMLRRF